MICDLAETYHVFNYRELPVKLLATLVSGLRADSRTKMAINGTKVPTNTLLLAMIHDDLMRWMWMNTKDGRHQRNEPKSLAQQIMNPKPKEKDVVSFETGEDFDKARAKIIGGS
jgi:hypothetical protein